MTSGGTSSKGELSFLPGQKLSRCTCPGESHPGPVHADGTYVGRSAPEIDIFEAQVDGEKGGTVSQSGQWAVSLVFLHGDRGKADVAGFGDCTALQRVLPVV
jgi:hypothetical protein